MKKNAGRKERRRITRQERLERNEQVRIKAEWKVKMAMRKGIVPKPAEEKVANFGKQNPKWFNRRKKVTMTRLWAKKKAN